MRELLAPSGRPIEECRAILNFGCGCGRVLRHWKDLGATAVCSHGSECRTRSMVPGPPPVRVGVSELRRAADVFRRWALRCNLCFLNTYTCACEYSETLASRVSQALEARRITDLQHSRKLLLTPPDQSRATAISRWTTCCPIRIGRWKQPMQYVSSGNIRTP